MQRVDNFISYILIEKGLSKNTALAYRTDLNTYLKFLEKKKINYETITHLEITDFLWHLQQSGSKPTSVYRMIESIRQFYKFLVAENFIKTDPTINLTGNKLPEALPDILTNEEVTKLLNSVDRKSVV